MSEVKSGLAGLTHLSPAAPLLSSSLLFHCYHPRSHSSKQELLQILKNVKKKKKKNGHTPHFAALRNATNIGPTYTWIWARRPRSTNAREGGRKRPLTPGLHSTFLVIALHHALRRK